jgi:hypothetical protein
MFHWRRCVGAPFVHAHRQFRTFATAVLIRKLMGGTLEQTCRTLLRHRTGKFFLLHLDRGPLARFGGPADQHHITQTGYSQGVGSPPLAVTVALMDSRYTRRLVDPRSASIGRDPACERS